MHRKIVATGVLLTSLLVAMPLLAQDHVWTTDRPDGHAPAGVKADFTLPAGRFYVGFRYSADKFRGTLIGTQEVSDLEVLDFFSVAPLTLDRWSGEVEVRFGMGLLTAEASVPWVRNEMLSETLTGFFESSSEFIGDISLRGMIDLIEQDDLRLLVSLGATLPTGKISKRGTTAQLPRGILPFPMQGGSGRPDILAGGTFEMQNEVASVGAQINSRIHLKSNGKGYRLGDEFSLSVWGAYRVSDWVSFSLRGLYEQQADVAGSDPRMDGTIDPLANPFAQGGERIMIPIGMNFYIREGLASGQRLSIEFYTPVHEDLNGPQLSAHRTLVASWQAVF